MLAKMSHYFVNYVPGLYIGNSCRTCYSKDIDDFSKYANCKSVKQRLSIAVGQMVASCLCGKVFVSGRHQLPVINITDTLSTRRIIHCWVLLSNLHVESACVLAEWNEQVTPIILPLSLSLNANDTHFHSTVLYRIRRIWSEFLLKLSVSYFLHASPYGRGN